MLYIIDESKNLDIEEIEQKGFTHQVSSQFALGASKGNVWFKIELKNSSDLESVILYLLVV